MWHVLNVREIPMKPALRVALQGGLVVLWTVFSLVSLGGLDLPKYTISTKQFLRKVLNILIYFYWS